MTALSTLLLASLVAMVVLTVYRDHPGWATVALVAVILFQLTVTGMMLRTTAGQRGASASGRLRRSVYLLHFAWALIVIPVAIITATGGDDPDWGQMVLGLPLAAPAAVQWLMHKRGTQRSADRGRRTDREP
ncbi:hypothetical protein [Streptomyces lincolnensis]|uniref:hypothetical protein n=1 Tax=Streptomyces lincolnensis TaxID=1915 RepID=UPI0008313C8D|nr:hypothetical protein [Streptomyces lincolnensis]QMV04393.1 hypothetical protein GJU35_01070 [Streptomyces lincolnensis]QMV11931.1 hypothetical protein GJU35_43850 [Streptomyces lincolnensis]